MEWTIKVISFELNCSDTQSRVPVTLNRSEFEQWRCDIGQLERSLTDVIVVIATTRGSGRQGYADEEGRAYDFVSRCFAPWSGVPEDPVTGGLCNCTDVMRIDRPILLTHSV